MTEKLSEFLETTYDFRQYIVFIMVLLISVPLLLKHFINGGQFEDLIKNVAVALYAIHGIQHLTDLGKNWIASKLPNTKTNT